LQQIHSTIFDLCINPFLNMSLSFEDLFYKFAAVISATVILYYAQGILIPVAFALLFAFILFPVVNWMIKKKMNKMLAIVLTMTGVLTLILGTLVLFSAQIIEMGSEYDGFLAKLESSGNAFLEYLNNKVQVIPDIESQDIFNSLSNIFTDSGFVIISDTIGFTSSFLSFLALSLIYTFLILFYKDHFVGALTLISSKNDHNRFRKMLKQIQQVGQEYFTGMLLLLVILGILNSLGLLVIGIDYPFFFGFLAALLAIIPYVGTALGGLIPAVYALVTYDSYWYAVGVVGVFSIVQTIEGNLLTPKVVGGSMQINPMASILALIIGGTLWGLPGMILFLPLAAMLRVVCNHYDNLKPIAELLGDDHSSTSKVRLIDRISNVLKSKD